MCAMINSGQNREKRQKADVNIRCEKKIFPGKYKPPAGSKEISDHGFGGDAEAEDLH